MINPEVRELYKYRVFNKHSISNLVDNLVWVPSQRDLNDPFEYSFHVEPDMSFEAAAKRNSRATKENFREEQDKLIEKLLSDFIPGGVYCLSEARNIALMWSHYADSHRGYCVGYARDPMTLLGSEKCNPVQYRDFPRLKFSHLFQAMESRNVNDGKVIFDSMVLSKDPNWSYEREWRLLFDQVNQLVVFGAEIRSITFGIRMPEEEKRKIKEALVRKPGVEFFQAMKPRNGWDLELKPIT